MKTMQINHIQNQLRNLRIQRRRKVKVLQIYEQNKEKFDHGETLR